jgi:hypothetical protein
LNICLLWELLQKTSFKTETSADSRRAGACAPCAGFASSCGSAGIAAETGRLHGHWKPEDPIQVVRLVAPPAIAGEVFLARMNAL